MQTFPKHIEREPLRLFQKNPEQKNKAPVFKVTKNTKPQPLRPKSHALLPKERQACDMATD